MGKLIRKSILFVFVSLVGYALFLLLWGIFMPAGLKKNLVYKRGGKGFMYSRMEEIKSVHDIDVLFIGSSLTARGFDTRIFAEKGYKTFNLGSGGQTPLQSEWLLKRYLDQINPKFIIVEVSPYLISRDGVEPAVDLISNHEFEWSLFEQAFVINSIKVYNTLLFSCWRKYLNLNGKFNEAKVKGFDTYISGGFVEREIGYFKMEDLKEDPDYYLKPLNYQEKSLINIVSYIKSKHIPYYLVQLPLTKAIIEDHGHYFDCESFFQNTGTFVNFYNRVELIDTLHFFDSRHVNQYGVEILDEAVIKILLEPSGIKKIKPE